MTDIDKIPAEVLDALRERGHSDARIAKMDPVQMFKEYCNWHGLINWGGTLWAIVAELSELEEKAE